MTADDGEQHAVGEPDPATFTTPADWAAGLALLRERAGLSVRDLARAAGASASTVGGYVAGRHLPTPAATPTVRALLAACAVPDPQPWLDALVRLRRAPAARRDDTVAPYKGLAGYDVDDAPWFCGREALTAELVERARRDPDRPLLLVGPSGSGKSSILRAGLAAATADDGGRLVVLSPGADPDGAVRAAAEQALGSVAAGHRVLVVVDQLEELWTTGAPDDAWRSAVRRLADLAATDGVVAAAALRADFYAHALASETLAAALQTDQVVVGPMSRDELVRAVTRPAERAGVALEPGLVDVLLGDLAPRGARPDGDAYDPGALPLLSFALLQTWQRHRSRLTVADYTGSGGIAGAVAAAAEQVYDALGPREQELARRLFLRLVAVGEETADTRRRVGHDELDALEPTDPGPGVADVVERFVAARLLTAGERHVEITHEALLVAWPRLRGWLDDDRAGLVVQRSLADSAAAWQRSGRDAEQLLRGTRLEAARQWAADPDHAAVLTADERAFVAESQAQGARRRAAERGRSRRLQLLSGVLAVALVAVAGLAAYAQDLRGSAEDERDLTRSRQLAEAANRVRAVDPAVAARFALLAYRTAPTVEARSAMLDATALPLARRLEGPGGIAAVAVSGDGRRLAAVGAGGGLRLWDLPPGDAASTAPRRLATVASASAAPDLRELYAVALDTTGQRVLTGGLGGGIRLWSTADPTAPRVLAEVDTQGLTVYSLVFGRDGLVAAALAGNDPGGALRQVGRVGLWRLTGSGLEPVADLLDVGDVVQAAAFDRTGEVLAVGTGAGLVHRFRVSAGGTATSTGDPLTGPTEIVTSLAFAPDGRSLAAGSRDLRAHVWSLPDPTGDPVPPDPAEPETTARTLEGAQSWVNTVSFSPDGGTLAAGSADSRLRVYDTTSFALVADVGNPGPVTGTVHTGDGAALVTAGADGSVRITPEPLPVAAFEGGRTFALGYLDDERLVGANATAARVVDVGRPFTAIPSTGSVRPPGGPEDERFAGTLAVDRSRRLVASGGRAGTTWLYTWTGTGLVLLGTSSGQQEQLVQSAAFTADGRHLVTGSDDATLAVTDVSAPDRPVAVGAPVGAGGVVYALAASPDGRLLAAGTGTQGAVRIWDVSDPARPRVVGEAPPGPTLQVYGLSFSRDSQVLAVGSADRSVRLLDVSAPASPRWLGRPLTGPGDYVFSLQISADGRRLAVASGDGTVRLYDLERSRTALPYAVLTAAGRVALYSVAFAPDGDRVSAAGAPEAVLTWTLDAEAAARRVCALAGDPISDEEWARYLPSVRPEDPCSR